MGFTCSVCDETFNEENSLYKHAVMHTNIKSEPENIDEMCFACDKCDKSFDDEAIFDEHLRSHDEDSFEDEKLLVDAEFSNEITLGDSLTGQKPRGDRIYTCHICRDTFNCLYYLHRHTRNDHDGEKPQPIHECEKCGMKFYLKHSLERHYRSQTHDNKRTCEICNKVLSRKHIMTHLKKHLGENAFVCNVCKEGFRTKYALSKHSTVHTGENRYVCNICQKSFCSKDYVKQHYRVHTGEKPFQCEVCRKSFFDKCSLRYHLMTHSKEKPFKCQVCQRGFTRKNILTRHLETHRELQS